MTKILFVCLGNICRSPMAEGVFRHVAQTRGLIAGLEVESAGTGSWHIGDPPDARAQAAAAERGIDISAQRARQVGASDFSGFDLLLGMDHANIATLRRMAPADATADVRLFLEFATGTGTQEVPDPYYGGAAGFDHALDLIAAASHGLADHVKSLRG